MSARRIFFGDIQGCRVELEELLETLRYDPAADELHPVGDLVNRGPDSAGVLRLLRSLGAGGVLGNHDLHCLGVARGTREAGPRDTLADLLRAPDRDELLDWLARRPFVQAWSDLLLVHAGVHPAWIDPAAVLAGLDPYASHPAADFVTRVRYCTREGERPDSDWPPPGAPYRPWYEFWEERVDEPRTVVFGHWARLGKMDRARAKCLDSGCVWGKSLTAWIPEEARFVSVPARRVWSAQSSSSEKS